MTTFLEDQGKKHEMREMNVNDVIHDAECNSHVLCVHQEGSVRIDSGGWEEHLKRKTSRLVKISLILTAIFHVTHILPT